jgi:hypothetical protein
MLIIVPVIYIHLFLTEHCPNIEEEILSHPIFNDELTKDEYGSSALKHLKQQVKRLRKRQESDRQTDRWTDRQNNGQTNGQTDR